MLYYRLFCTVALGAGTIFAQSSGDEILKTTKSIPATTPATFSQHAFPGITSNASAEPANTNFLTVLGDNVDNSGVPCFDCVTGAQGNTLGLVAPDGNVHADGATAYVFNNYSFDNSYTGNCEYTFLVRDSAGKYILKLGPLTFAETPGSIYLTSAAGSLPVDPNAVGNGLAITVIKCSSTTGVSEMPLYINYP